MAYLDPIDRVANQFWSVFQPPPDLSVSEWADAELYLSPEDSSEPGKFRIDRAPYQKEMMDAVSDPSIKEVVFCTASQIGKSLISKAVLGYHIHQDPGPILVIQPTTEMAETFSKDRLAPMIRDTPALRELIADPKSRNTGNTVLHKALCLKTPIPAPSGWTTMGDVRAGDVIFGEDGRPTRVLSVSEIFHNRPCYKVSFSDGESIIADEGHLWGVYVWKIDKRGEKPKQVRKYKVLETGQMLEYKKNNRLVYSVKNNDPLDLEEIDLPIDPYILGAWLGDGYKHQATICGAIEDAEIGDLLRAAGATNLRTRISDNRLMIYRLDHSNKGDSEICPNGHLRSEAGTSVGKTGKRKCKKCHAEREKARRGAGQRPKPVDNTYLKKLRALGVSSFPGEPSVKHIPAIYLRSSIRQRLSLLQGLMDTDGHVSKKGGACIFTTSYDDMADGFSDLLSGMGIKFHRTKVDTKIGRPANIFHFQTDLLVFRLTRKAETFKATRPNLEWQKYKQITSIEPVESVPVKCVSVDNESRLFLAGPRMTPTHNSFRGGHITMIGSNAPSGLASRPIRIVFADEVDRYPTSAGTEGDPLFLARQRSVTFHNRKFIMASTPTIEGSSRIWKAFEKSDQRYLYLPCPHCGEFHTLKFGNMHWDDRDPTSARMVCTICGAYYTDADKMRMLAEHEWRAKEEFTGTAGFHVSALYSPWQKFSDIVKEFLDKKDHPETMKTFVNLQLGECWEDRSGETVDHAALMARRESWDINAIPDDVVLITAGIDTQDDRLECTLLGWTGMEQARVLDHLQLWGNPGDATVWTELDAILQAQYQTDMGRLLRIRAACIDSGGSHTQRVYEFCRSRANRKVFPIKGRPGSHPLWPNKVSKSKLSNGVQLYLIGVDTGKDMMRSAFGVGNPDRPRYVSFAAGLPDAYFVQLVSEKRVTTTNKAGFPVVTWKKPQGVRNEALDCFNYAQAALEALKASGVRLKAVAQNVAATRPRQPATKPAIPVEAMPVANPVRQPMRATRRQSSAIL